MDAELYEIRQCYPTNGDWIQVQLERINHNGVDVRICLSRVIMWALISSKEEPDRIEAITGSGDPRSAMGDTHLEFYYVRASDQCPDGRTWNELFDAAVPNRHGVRPLTKEQARAFQDDIFENDSR